jgi:hypothetical protein
MAEFRNPPVIDGSAGAPANATVLVYQASTDTWVPTAAASVGLLTVPQASPSVVAEGTSALATTAATQTTPWGFASEAQAEAIATKFNLAVTDITNIKTEIASIVTKLVTAGIFD